MSIQLTFAGESLFDLETQMQMFLANVGAIREATETVPEEEAVPEEPKKTRKRTTTLKKPAPEKEVEEEVQDQEILANAAGAADAEPETEEEGEKPDTSGKEKFDASETRRKAISKLMVLYNVGGETQKAVKALLTKYDVKKFSEVGDDVVADLMKDANTIEAKAAA